MSAKQRGEIGLLEALFGDTDHGVVKLGVGEGRGTHAIQFKEVECGRDGGALVAVDERLVFRQMR